MPVFGFGKPKMQLGQFCRVFAHSLIELPDKYNDFRKFDALGLLDGSIFNILIRELGYFQHAFFSLLLAQKGLIGKLKFDSYDIGYIHAQATRLAFEDAGYDEREIEEAGSIISEYTEFLVQLVQDGLRLKEKEFYMFIAGQYANRFVESVFDGKSNSELTSNVRGLISLITYQVCKTVGESFEVSFSSVKLVG